jgi:hypothetical protein
MRGDAQFFISVIYSAIVVFIIYVIAQGFLSAQAGEDPNKPLDLMDRVIEAGGTNYIDIESNGELFVWFAGEVHEQCEEHVEEIRAACRSGDLCFCYLFDATESSQAVCRSRSLASVPDITGSDGVEVVTVEEKGVCAWAEGGGLYSLSYENDVITLKKESS